MFGVTKKCQVDGCERAASGSCFCCNKNVCRRHFLEHSDNVKAQIDPLANDTNEMVENTQNCTIEKLTEPAFAQLEQWKIDMHKLIDEIHSAKSKEMEDLIDKNKEKFIEHQEQQMETVMEIQDQVKQLVEDDDVTCEQIQMLKDQLAGVKTNRSNFATNFLVINTNTTPVQGLVNISTNLNRPIFAFPTAVGASPFMFGTTSSGTDNSKPPPSLFTGLGAALQYKPTASTSTFGFWTVPSMTTNTFASTGTSPFASPFSTPPTFGVNHEKKK